MNKPTRELDCPNPWTLRRLIGKYTQICKLAAQCHSIPTAKNLREQAVLECLIELENLRREAAVSNNNLV